jgi:pimeloyl-ACP methyl ester carboxylesterase
LSARTLRISYITQVSVSVHGQNFQLIFAKGGPGGSGVEAVQGSGKLWSEQWGMNLVSFDPRSVGLSGPKVSCVGPVPGNEALARRQEDSIIVGDLAGEWEKNLKSNTECAINNKDTEMKYVGTSAVVQDMIHFAEHQAALRGADPETAHINYFGTSYGTLLGSTLVGMYPERVRRVLPPLTKDGSQTGLMTLRMASGCSRSFVSRPAPNGVVSPKAWDPSRKSNSVSTALFLG